MKAQILIVDDEEGIREALADKLRHSGHRVETADSAEAALGRIGSEPPALIITDVRMAGLSGLDLLARVKDALPETDVIVMTAHEDMSTAVTAMKSGAFDYLVKPVKLAELDQLVARCLQEQELTRLANREEAEDPVVGPPAGSGVVGRDPRMIEIYKTIGVLARNRTTVMVRGETGTGKEIIARAIHINSAHAAEPFIAVNCTALSDTLLESELFGHVKGAFTGAVTARKGYFELAGAGTIFLDEIGDTSSDFQTKLLRVLQDRTFYPVGGESPMRTKARVIAATHQPMEALVEEGSFREDLYFRLRVVEVHVPPLRERRDDIPILAKALLAQIRAEAESSVRRISKEAMERLIAYDWPGNVRELENALTRGVILARGSTLAPDHLSLGVRDGATREGAGIRRGTPGPEGEDLSLDRAVADHVQAVLEKTVGNKSQAARLLGISRSRLQRYVERFSLDVP